MELRLERWPVRWAAILYQHELLHVSAGASLKSGDMGKRMLEMISICCTRHSFNLIVPLNGSKCKCISTKRGDFR